MTTLESSIFYRVFEKNLVWIKKNDHSHFKRCIATLNHHSLQLRHFQYTSSSHLIQSCNANWLNRTFVINFHKGAILVFAFFFIKNLSSTFVHVYFLMTASNPFFTSNLLILGTWLSWICLLGLVFSLFDWLFFNFCTQYNDWQPDQICHILGCFSWIPILKITST